MAKKRTGEPTITAGTLKLSPKDAETFAMAIADYDFETPAHFLRLCARMLIQHYEAGDQVAWPLRLRLVTPIDNDQVVYDADNKKDQITPDKTIDKTKEQNMSEQPMDKSKRLTVQEVAKLLGFNEFTIYKMARTGRIPCIRIRRHLRFRLEDIERWEDKHGYGKI